MYHDFIRMALSLFVVIKFLYCNIQLLPHGINGALSDRLLITPHSSLSVTLIGAECAA